MPKEKKGLGPFIGFLVKIGDFVLLNLLLIVIYYTFNDYLSLEVHENAKAILLVVNLSYAVALSFFGVRLTDRVVVIEIIIKNAFYIALLHFILVTSCFAILNFSGISCWVILLFSCTMCIFLIIWRVSLRILLKQYRKKGGNFINVVIIGIGETAKHLYEEMKNDVFSGFNILGFFSDDEEEGKKFPQYLGKLDKLESFNQSNRIDELYYTLPIKTGEHFQPILRFTRMNMINFFVVPNFNRILKRKIELVFLDNTPLFKFETEPLAKRSNRIIKRSLDIVFASLVILLTYPVLFLIVAPIIKLTSKGPVLFKQERTGLKGEDFTCYKFRSMSKNKDADNIQATKNDSRITRIGTFLRKTSLDEMPQFINVLKGDMSVVGPRPHMKKHTEEYSSLIEKYMFRHMVKPGITGWAQVTGYRGETRELEQMQGRVERDVWYIENWSVLLDIKIILRTVWNAIHGEENAY